MAKRMIKLQPTTGKFLQTTVNGRNVNVFLVDPKTNTDGTDIPYEDAMKILAYRHPVAKVAQIKDKKTGKYIEQLTDKDRAYIAKLREEGVNSVATAADDSSIKSLVETQTALLKAQAAMLEKMQSEIDELKKAKPAKASKAKTK